MWTVLSCVLFALIGAGIAAYLSRGRHPAAIIVGLIVGAMFGLAPLTLARQLLADSAKGPGLFDQIGLLIEALRGRRSSFLDGYVCLPAGRAGHCWGVGDDGIRVQA